MQVVAGFGIARRFSLVSYQEQRMALNRMEGEENAEEWRAKLAPGTRVNCMIEEPRLADGMCRTMRRARVQLDLPQLPKLRTRLSRQVSGAACGRGARWWLHQTMIAQYMAAGA